MQKDDATWLKIAYAGFALIAGYVAWKAFGTIGLQTGLSQRISAYPAISMAGTILIAVGLTWYLMKDPERHDYFLLSIGELRRVTWPSFIDTRRMTIVVCVVVGIFAVILAVFDYAWAEVLKLLLSS